MNSHTILCGACKCAAKTVPDPKSHDQVTCPRCGRSDRFDNVMRTVNEHIAHGASKMLHDGLTKAVRGSKFIKVTGQRPGYRSFRWVAGNFGG